MDKKRNEPQAWKWEEGVVDRKEEHIKVGYGDLKNHLSPWLLWLQEKAIVLRYSF